MINNFDIIRQHLDFKLPTDRYIVHILRRPKDCEGLKNELGSNEAQRLIRTYYIDSLEYFDAKIPAMKELCESCNARAYIIVQPKDNFECLLNLGKKIFDTIQNKNYSVKPEHLIRQAYCEWHKSRKKVWILDLDDEEMYGWTREQVMELVKKYVKACGKDENECYTVKTKHGCHIITPPFNLMEAYKECDMLFEGVQNRVLEPTMLDDSTMKMNYKKVVGWLHKDGMTLLYCL